MLNDSESVGLFYDPTMPDHSAHSSVPAPRSPRRNDLSRRGPGRLRLESLEERSLLSSYYYFDAGKTFFDFTVGHEVQVRPGAVYRVAPDGTETVYTDTDPTPGIIFGLDVLPDGDLVVGRTNTPNTVGTSESILRIDLDPETPEGVTSWKPPKGSRVAAVAAGPNGVIYFLDPGETRWVVINPQTAKVVQHRDGAVYRVGSNGKPAKIFTDKDPRFSVLTDLAVLPDGDLVLARTHNYPSTGQDVLRIDVDPKTKKRITEIPTTFPVSAVASGPDKSAFYYLDAGETVFDFAVGHEVQVRPGSVYRAAASGAGVLLTDSDPTPGVLTDLAVFRDKDLLIGRSTLPNTITGTYSTLQIDPATPEVVTSSEAIEEVVGVAVARPAVVPEALKVEPNGDVTFKVRVNVPALTRDTEVGVYWTTGEDMDPAADPVTETFTLKEGTKLGLIKKTFKVPAENVLVAPEEATSLAVITDRDSMTLPSGGLNAGWIGDRVDARFSTDDLTVKDLQKIMPGLKGEDADRLLGPMKAAMQEFGIRTLEQRAMFLGQLAHESGSLTHWVEKPNPKNVDYDPAHPDTYFINFYWKKPTRWKNSTPATGEFIPTPTGLTLRIKNAGAGPTKDFDLYWAQGTSFAGLTPIPATFTRSGTKYVLENFAGADPATLPKFTTHLLVVDPDASQVVLALENLKLRNWRVKDVLDYRGRGPIQLTGRYNYQRFADFIGDPSVMTDPTKVSDKNNPALGMQSAGWFWKAGNDVGQDLNVTVDEMAGRSSEDLNLTVSTVINQFDTKNLGKRLSRYRRAWSVLLVTPDEEPAP